MKHKKKNDIVNCPALTLLDAHSGTEFKRALDELVISKLCSACWLMNGDTKQIRHLLKVCLFVWEEAKPWISTVGLYKGEKQSGRILSA